MDFGRNSRALRKASIESFTSPGNPRPLVILTSGSRSSKPYARLKRALVYSAASAANQSAITDAPGRPAIESTAMLTLDQASSNALLTFSSRTFFSSEDFSATYVLLYSTVTLLAKFRG